MRANKVSAASRPCLCKTSDNNAEILTPHGPSYKPRALVVLQQQPSELGAAAVFAAKSWPLGKEN